MPYTSVARTNSREFARIHRSSQRKEFAGYNAQSSLVKEIDLVDN